MNKNTFLNTLIIGFLVYVNSCIFSNFRYVSLEITQLTNSLNIVFNMSDPSRQKYFEIDLGIDFNFASYRYYNNFADSIIRLGNATGNVNSKNRDILFEYLQDIARIEGTEITIPDFHLYYTPQYLSSFDSITLKNYRFINGNVDNLYEKFNIVFVLYKMKIISHRRFIIDIMNKDYKGYLHLGNFPIERNNNFLFKFNSDNRQGLWNCPLKKFTFGNKIYNISNIQDKYIAYFQVKEKSVLLPEEIYDDIINNHINEYYIKYACKDRNKYLECKCGILSEIANIMEFEVEGGYTFSYNLNLSSTSNIFGLCEIMFYSSQSNAFVFGYRLFSQYVIAFDYENNDISFYDGRSSLSAKKIYQTYILKIIMVISGIGLGLLGIQKFGNKRYI